MANLRKGVCKMSKKISIAILCIFIANIVSIVCNGIDFFNGISVVFSALALIFELLVKEN